MAVFSVMLEQRRIFYFSHYNGGTFISSHKFTCLLPSEQLLSMSSPPLYFNIFLSFVLNKRLFLLPSRYRNEFFKHLMMNRSCKRTNLEIKAPASVEVSNVVFLNWVTKLSFPALPLRKKRLVSVMLIGLEFDLLLLLLKKRHVFVSEMSRLEIVYHYDTVPIPKTYRIGLLRWKQSYLFLSLH